MCYTDSVTDVFSISISIGDVASTSHRCQHLRDLIHLPDLDRMFGRLGELSKAAVRGRN